MKFQFALDLKVDWAMVVALLLTMFSTGNATAQNYIRYHQKSLVVQEYMAQGDTAEALALLAKLEKKYGLMPTETFARALCQATMGDTAAARRSYLESFRQRAPIGWLFDKRTPVRSMEGLYWYRQLEDECWAFWHARPEYVDGPNGTVPTVSTYANRRFQFIRDSVDMIKSKVTPSPSDSIKLEEVYTKVVNLQTMTLDSIIKGLLPFPSIAKMGVNSEFELMVLHSDGNYTYAHRKLFKEWLKQGLIYPRVYAICFDRRHQVRGEPLPYGYLNCLKPEDLVPGYEKRRAAIGMGDDRLDEMRFHWSLDCGD